MKLDPKQLRAEADAHAERMASPLWTATQGEQDKSWLAPLTGIAPASTRTPRPRPDAHASRPDAFAPERQSSVEDVEQAVQRVADTASWRPMGADGLPRWRLALPGTRILTMPQTRPAEPCVCESCQVPTNDFVWCSAMRNCEPGPEPGSSS